MYYGNASAPAASNGTATFPFFDNFANPVWTSLSPMPFTTADQTVASVNNKFYIIGGYNNGDSDPLNVNYQYDPATNTYTQKTNMPTKRWGPIATAINNLVYVFGGSTATSGSAANEVYSPATNTWTTKASLPSAIAQQGITGCTNGMNAYLFYNGLSYRYNVAANTYTKLAPPPDSIVSWASCSYSNGKIYLIGGWNDGGQTYTQIYDIAANTWTTGASMPFGLYGLLRENPVINGTIYAVRGQRQDGEFSSKAYAYNIASNTWSEESFGPHAADGVAGGVYNNKIYTFGGRQDWTGPYGLNYAAVYDPSQDTSSPWKQVSGNFEMSGSTLHQMLPTKGAGTGITAQIQTNSYQTSGNFILEAQSMQTSAGDSWNGLAVNTNAGVYDSTLNGYQVPYNDYGVSPTATSLYKETGTSFTSLQSSTPVATGAQRYKVVSTPSQLTLYRNGTQTLTTNDATYRNGYLNVDAGAQNSSSWNFIFTRTYSPVEPTSYVGNSQQQASFSCPCSVWGSDAAPASSSASNTTAYELGTRFYSETPGYITALRFYKEPGMASTHTGHLWDASGTLLATATYSNESASGWQQAQLATPVAITADTAYVSSYVITTGPFAYTQSQFAAQSIDDPPLHLYRDGTSTPNGVFHSGGSGFPATTWSSTNYWSDAVFTTSSPIVTNLNPSASCISSGELCSPMYNVPFTASNSNAAVDFTVPAASCSSLRLHFYVDGVPTVTSSYFGWHGAGGSFDALPLDSGWLNLGPDANGLHTLAVQAEGQISGCNTGSLGSWSGSLKLAT